MNSKERRAHKQAKQIAYARAKQVESWTTAKLLHSGQKAGKFDATQTYKKLNEGIITEELYDYCVGILASNSKRKAKKRD